MTSPEAIRIAEDWLARQPCGDRFHVVAVELEDDLALAFWTARSGELIAGNALLLIDTRSGYVHVTGTGQTMRYYVENFRVTGDPHIEPVAVAKIIGWREGAKKVSAVTILKENANFGLVRAKACVDSVLGGQEVEVLPREGVTAGEICAMLDQVGFITKELLRAPEIKEHNQSPETTAPSGRGSS
ncbi:MAG: hypothetical protein SFY80_15835 [Verrucomicrobiota bacterium]|nr:hypothetical protein [Verrucomicrobiota bacterium]